MKIYGAIWHLLVYVCFDKLKEEFFLDNFQIWISIKIEEYSGL